MSGGWPALETSSVYVKKEDEIAIAASNLHV
jgi:hypothetical protein